MIPLPIEIFLVLFFLVLHAFFSLAETSVLNIRKSRLREVIDDDESPEKRVRRAKTLLGFKLHPERFLATVQMGAVFSSFMEATYSAFLTYDHVWPFVQSSLHLTKDASLTLAFIGTILIVTVIDLTFGALIPKSIALHSTERISFGLAEVIRILSRLLKPVTHLPVAISNLVLRPFRDKTSFTEGRISEEEFRVILEEGAREGMINQTENELLENIFEFRDRTVREVMIPRVKMSAIDLDSAPRDVIERIIQEGYTRLPAYKDSIDNIQGVIYSKDVIAILEHPDLLILYDIIRPALFIPETKQLSELLREFQRAKQHMAIVVDEFGGTAGIVTLEDILEEIVGEIHDEYDEDPTIAQIDHENHTVTLSANLSISGANEYLESIFPNFHIPDNEEYESVSGYVNKLFGYIPDLGESREMSGVRIVVTKRATTTVLQVRFESTPMTTFDRVNPDDLIDVSANAVRKPSAQEVTTK